MLSTASCVSVANLIHCLEDPSRENEYVLRMRNHVDSSELNSLISNRDADVRKSHVLLYPPALPARELVECIKSDSRLIKNSPYLWVDSLCSSVSSSPRSGLITLPSFNAYHRMLTETAGISLFLHLGPQQSTLSNIVNIYFIYMASRQKKPIDLMVHRIDVYRLLEALNEEPVGRIAFAAIGLPQYQEDIYYPDPSFEEFLEVLLEHDSWTRVCEVVYVAVFEELIRHLWIAPNSSQPRKDVLVELEELQISIQASDLLARLPSHCQEEAWVYIQYQLTVLYIMRKLWDDGLQSSKKCEDYYHHRYGAQHRYSILTFKQSCTCHVYVPLYEDLEPKLKALITLCQDFYGKESIHYFHSLFLIGRYYSDIGDYNQAATRWMQCLQGQKQFLGEDHVSTLETMHQLAYNYQMQHNYDLSLRHFLKYVEIIRPWYGLGFQNALSALLTIANIYALQQKYPQAIATYEEIIAYYVQTYGYNHFNTVQTQQLLAQILVKANRREEAEILLYDCLQRVIFLYGEEHTMTKLYRSYYEDVLVNNMGDDDDLLMAAGRPSNPFKPYDEKQAGMHPTRSASRFQLKNFVSFFQRPDKKMKKVFSAPAASHMEDGRGADSSPRSHNASISLGTSSGYDCSASSSLDSLSAEDHSELQGFAMSAEDARPLPHPSTQSLGSEQFHQLHIDLEGLKKLSLLLSKSAASPVAGSSQRTALVDGRPSGPPNEKAHGLDAGRKGLVTSSTSDMGHSQASSYRSHALGSFDEGDSEPIGARISARDGPVEESMSHRSMGSASYAGGGGRVYPNLKSHREGSLGGDAAQSEANSTTCVIQ